MKELDVFNIVVGCFSILSTIVSVFALVKVNQIQKNSIDKIKQRAKGDRNQQVGIGSINK